MYGAMFFLTHSVETISFAAKLPAHAALISPVQGRKWAKEKNREEMEGKGQF